MTSSEEQRARAASKATQWERIRTWSVRVGIFWLASVFFLIALSAPVSFIRTFLIGLGLTIAVYLYASAASGWYEGKSER